MSDPIEALMGVKGSAVLAGLVGGIVSLSFMRDLTPVKAVLATLSGAASAAYLTPLVVHYLDVEAPAEHAVAFLAGLIGMNILAGVFKLSERFKQRPLDTIRDVQSLKSDGNEGRDDEG